MENSFVKGKETVTITKKEYDRLLQKSEFLECLKACGVDNWAGYSEAREMFNGSEQEE